jgi:hypothetical protein
MALPAGSRVGPYEIQAAIGAGRMGEVYRAHDTRLDRTSNESGRFEVYAQTFPLSDRTWSISTSGGSEPRWRAGGRELYYLSEDRKLMAVTVGAGASPFGVPRVLSQAPRRRGSASASHALCPRSRRQPFPDSRAEQRLGTRSHPGNHQLVGGIEPQMN